VNVNFLYKLRDERRFESFEALTRQIEADVAEARAYFHRRGAGAEALP